MYRSVFDVEKDISLIRDKMVSKRDIQRSITDPSMSQLILGHLTKNQIAKLEKLLAQ